MPATIFTEDEDAPEPPLETLLIQLPDDISAAMFEVLDANPGFTQRDFVIRALEKYTELTRLAPLGSVVTVEIKKPKRKPRRVSFTI